MSSLHQQYRERTAREMALAGNHWDAIQKHLDAYEAAFAHELAEKQRTALAADPGILEHDLIDLIDPKEEGDG